MHDYQFSKEEILKLEEYRDNQSDSRLKIRFMALLLIALRSPIEVISKTFGKCTKTIENWFNIYHQKGIDALNTFNYKPKKSYLNINEIHQVIIFVSWENPSTLKEIREYIEEKFGISYELETVRQLLKKYNLKIIYPKSIPGNRPSVEVQKKFIEDYENLKKTSEPGTAILFGDAMHLNHQIILSQCYGNPLFPPVIETNSGRKRLNILGAYNPDTIEFHHLTGEENCNAERFIEFLVTIESYYSTAPKIHLFLDNAKYFHANLVQDWLKEHPKINLIFLPSYSPNLNLIERLWRVAKKYLVRNKYYKEYKTFRAKTFHFLNNIHEYADELKRLLVEKFEIIYA